MTITTRAPAVPASQAPVVLPDAVERIAVP